MEVRRAERPLEGKAAIVTGAGRGIGRAIALGYAAAGAVVACAARSEGEIEATAAEIEGAGGRALAVRCDVADQQSVEEMVHSTVEAFGKLDVMVVNAGVNLDHATIFESEAAHWEATIHTNLVGAYYCVKAAAPRMRGNGGHIITVGSGRGHRADPGRTAYACSKAGLWMLTRALAEEVWSEGICVNELIPGPVDTEMLRESVAARAGGLSQEYEREWKKPPEAVVSLAIWMASAAPATGPTGQSFSLMRRDSQ